MRNPIRNFFREKSILLLLLVLVPVHFQYASIAAQDIRQSKIGVDAELLYKVSRKSNSPAIWHQTLTKVREFQLFQQIDTSSLGEPAIGLYKNVNFYYYPNDKFSYPLLGDSTTKLLWMLPENGFALVRHQSKNFSLSVYPVIGMEWNSIPNGVSGFTKHNYQGFEAEGKVDDNQTFSIRVTDHQGKLNFVPATIRTTLPGYGFVKHDPEKPGNVDFNDVSVEYRINSDYGIFSLGKNTPDWSINNESVILSNNVSGYPNVRWIKKLSENIQYETLWGELTHYIPMNVDTLTQHKYIAAHRLTYSPNSQMRFSFFESVIYAGRSFEPIYHIPFIFMRGAEHYAGSQDNANLGISAEFYFNPQWYLGYQFLIDDITTGKVFEKENNNKFAHLLGLTNVGSVLGRIYELKLTAAYLNKLTYLHRNTITNYYHYGDALGIDSEREKVNVTVDFKINEGNFYYGFFVNPSTVRQSNIVNSFFSPSYLFVNYNVWSCLTIEYRLSEKNSHSAVVRFGI